MRARILASFLFAAAAFAQEAVTNSIGMELVKIPAGNFVMGAQMPTCWPSRAEVDANENERCLAEAARDSTPGFLVKISRPFLIGKFEVTQQQYERVMGRNPSYYRGEGSERNPVDSVTWADAQAFVKRLNALEGTTAYRLPTEAEWEYAARAGRTGDRLDNAGKTVWLQGSSGGRTHPVGEQPANAFGLFDTYGNVWEWCQDSWAAAFPGKFAIDPPGPKTGALRVLKGGSALSHEKNIRLDVHAGRGDTDVDVGFRVVKQLR